MTVSSFCHGFFFAFLVYDGAARALQYIFAFLAPCKFISKLTFRDLILLLFAGHPLLREGVYLYFNSWLPCKSSGAERTRQGWGDAISCCQNGRIGWRGSVYICFFLLFLFVFAKPTRRVYQKAWLKPWCARNNKKFQMMKKKERNWENVQVKKNEIE